MKGGKAYSIVSSADHASVTGDCYTCDADVVFGNQLVRAFVLSQVPDSHIAAAIATNQLPLIGMDNDIINRHAVHIVTLYIATPRVPDLHSTIFAGRNEPLGFAVKSDASNV